jgi:hypothetical protein
MRTRVDLESGALAFKVHEGGLRAGEVAELLTPNTITGIRGSLVVAQVAGSDSDVTVLEAHKPIMIAPRANPAQATHLPVGHTVRVSGPRHAPRFGQIRRAPRERLAHAAELAEVPGRPRDGGQERAFQQAARAGRGDAHLGGRDPRLGGRQPARGEMFTRRTGVTAERHAEAAQAHRRARSEERDDTIERSVVTRGFGARR